MGQRISYRRLKDKGGHGPSVRYTTGERVHPRSTRCVVLVPGIRHTATQRWPQQPVHRILLALMADTWPLRVRQRELLRTGTSSFQGSRRSGLFRSNRALGLPSSLLIKSIKSGEGPSNQGRRRGPALSCCPSTLQCLVLTATLSLSLSRIQKLHKKGLIRPADYAQRC